MAAPLRWASLPSTRASAAIEQQRPWGQQDFLRAVGDRSLGTQARIEPKQLFSQTLGLAPETIDRWVAGGVVKPFKSVNGLQHFAVHTIDTAYALSRALELGVPVARMRRSLHQLRSCWRPMTRVLSQLEILAAQAQSQEQDQDRRRPSARPRLLEERTLSPRRLSSSTSGPMTNTGGDMESEVPKCLDDWLRQGALSGSIGDHLSAADAYQEALLMGGPKPDITYELAKALQRAGRSSEAAQRFLQTVELDPGYYKAWHRLGVCLLTSGQVEDAIPAFRKAINACPGYAEPHGFLAECLDVAQRESEATPHWRLFIDLAPHNPLAQHATERIEACRPGSAAES